jgi:hypothetical protein
MACLFQKTTAIERWVLLFCITKRHERYLCTRIKTVKDKWKEFVVTAITATPLQSPAVLRAAEHVIRNDGQRFSVWEVILHEEQNAIIS